MKITLEWGVVCIQLPAKYPRLLALLIGQVETLIWGII